MHLFYFIYFIYLEYPSSGPVLSIVLYMLKACLAASRTRLSQHLLEQPVLPHPGLPGILLTSYQCSGSESGCGSTGSTCFCAFRIRIH
jgi:hypothetical protein